MYFFIFPKMKQRLGSRESGKDIFKSWNGATSFKYILERS